MTRVESATTGAGNIGADLTVEIMSKSAALPVMAPFEIDPATDGLGVAATDVEDASKYLAPRSCDLDLERSR